MTMRVGSRRSPASPGSCTRRATHRELRSPYPRASPWPEGFRTAARGHPRLAESRKRRLRATVPKRRVAAIAGALAAVPATGGGEARASALGAIAKAQGAIGDSAGALATAQRVETRFDRNRLLGEIAFLALSAGEFGDALTASRAIMHCGRRAHCLASIAKAQGEAGDVPGAGRSIAEALEAAGDVMEEFDRVAALRALAPGEALSGLAAATLALVVARPLGVPARLAGGPEPGVAGAAGRVPLLATGRAHAVPGRRRLLAASRAQPPGDALGGAPMVALAVRGTLLLGAGLAHAALGRGRPLPVFRAQALGETLGGAPVVALQALFLAFPRGNTAGIGRSIP